MTITASPLAYLKTSQDATLTSKISTETDILDAVVFLLQILQLTQRSCHYFHHRYREFHNQRVLSQHLLKLIRNFTMGLRKYQLLIQEGY